MRSHVLYQGRRYVLAQDPPEEKAPEEEAPADPAATVDDELEGKTAPEEAERGDNLADLGLGDEGGAAPGEEGEDAKPEDPAEVSRQIEESPASNWKDYEQPILKDIKQQFGGAPVSLLDVRMESDADVDLGFYITGYVKFLGEVPHEIQDEYGDLPLHFKIFVGPDGKMIRSSLRFYTELDNR